ncbi:MAG: decarboxylating 6-phosphogluconate dehydrogenase [Actinobacteria bacterium]|nr:decarboxylating 6-phosphogluconate dehydrogenase [Actinomycetota bacterium]MCL6105726.1 decarboxylating 6-phosphogluconate dehydrogenase [Actinomycetota bacterium]
MKLAMIGLGKMGLGMTSRLINNGHQVVCFDLSPKARSQAGQAGGEEAADLKDAVTKLGSPAILWIMLPAGSPTDDTIDSLINLLKPGDIVIEGGNSHYTTAAVYANKLAERKVDFIDVGVSGGVWGLEYGYCLMAGGTKQAVSQVEPIFKALAPEKGYAHVGPIGAGHFVKMVHNGIEYGIMQSYAEGFQLMDAAKEFELDLYQISNIWQYGSVIRSWLLELIANSLAPEAGFEDIKGVVAESGEGRWTIQEAIDRKVPTWVISAALYARFASQDPDSFAARLVAAQRHQFGGHAIQTT